MQLFPLHKISDKFNGRLAFVRNADDMVSGSMPTIDYTHRDDYYIFLFLQTGSAKFSLDFEDIEMFPNTIRIIFPGQVHTFGEVKNIRGWLLAADPVLIKDKHKEVFKRASFMNTTVSIDANTASDLDACINIINRRLHIDDLSEDSVLESLLVSYISIFTQSYSVNFSPSKFNRAAELTFQFESLLSDNFATLKSPRQYADLMHITPVYLNEVVKRTTGQTASDAILEEIIIQAKRMLYYSNSTIKEISFALGYEDWSYFTRVFSKATTLTPSQFRFQNRK